MPGKTLNVNSGTVRVTPTCLSVPSMAAGTHGAAGEADHKKAPALAVGLDQGTPAGCR